jgi:aerobic-type carbon monoxide dehydrogenase small subunit (CoxS/CutS family)
MRHDVVVNGRQVTVDVRPADRLLDVLRQVLGLTGTKDGCGVGECGACTVLVDGRPRLACLTLALRVDGEVTTVEGLAESTSSLRRCFAEEGGMQCGFCTSGQVVNAHHVVTQASRRGVTPTEQAVRADIAGNLCRCTGYAGIVRAIMSDIERPCS